MNARLIKETRDLLPIFACTLPLIVVPSLLWADAGFGYFALVVACLLMAGSSFGNEFQHRTLLLLLSQPIARSVIWREKMLILGAGILASLAALLGCLAIHHPVNDSQVWLGLVLVPLCAFCGAPYWTLSLRHSIAGMVLAMGAPCGIVAVYTLVAEWLGGNTPDALCSAVLILLSIYCAVVYWLGYSKFKRLEAVEAPARELGLPAGLEAFLTRPLTKLFSRFRGPFASLLKKEFRLQQVSFLLTGIFLLVAMAGGSLHKHYPEVATGMVGGDLFIYMLVLPLIAGAISIGEERGWGIAEWHLTLPPSARKQWSAKMLATLSTSLVLGLLLPAAVFLAADPLFNKNGTDRSLPSDSVIIVWVLSQLLVTSVAVYAASFSNNTLRALLASLAILAAAGGVLWLATIWVHEIGPAPLGLVGEPNVVATMVMPLLPTALACLLGLIQWFAWANYRSYGPSPLRLVVQFATLLLAGWVMAWAFCSALSFL